MKILVLGATGKIGGAIVSELAPRHEIVSVGSRSGDLQVDYTDRESVRSMFESVESFDGLVCVVGGDSSFKPYDQLTDGDFEWGFRRKFLAQLNLVRIGTDFAADGASFTLSSGFLSHYPNAASVATGPFNAAVDALATSLSPLLPRGLRINVVSPAPVVPSDRVGMGLVSAEQTAGYFVQCVEGDFTGRVLRAWGGLERKHAP
jgi:NAD(P)-dependent dehydrogenase (short-subunit alcohol dehydrogenase family)